MKKYIEFDGFCPESKLKGEQVEMRLNENDFWESEKTGLQIVISEPYAVILKWRGSAQLRHSSPKASDMLYGLFLTESMDIKGQEILPYQEGLFADKWDLEDYIDGVYKDEEEYLKDMFDPKDKVFERQVKLLKKISQKKYEELIQLYNEAKPNWYHGEEFTDFHEKLYKLKIIFSFNWMRWTEGRRILKNPLTDYSEYSMLELSMFITGIFRSDRFDDTSIQEYYENGVLDKIFYRLQQLISSGFNIISILRK